LSTAAAIAADAVIQGNRTLGDASRMKIGFCPNLIHIATGHPAATDNHCAL